MRTDLLTFARSCVNVAPHYVCDVEAYTDLLYQRNEVLSVQIEDEGNILLTNLLLPECFAWIEYFDLKGVKEWDSERDFLTAYVKSKLQNHWPKVDFEVQILVRRSWLISQSLGKQLKLW